MSNASHFDAKDQGSAAEPAEARLAGSRRSLLAGAGGFAFAASGLLLPDWLVEEAEADNHPVRRIQQRKEKRRRKGGHKRRTHGDKKDKLRDDESWVPRIAIAVHNYRNSAVRLQGWQVSDERGCGPDCAAWEMPTVWNWREIPGRTGNQHGHTEFVSARAHIAVRIGDGHAVEAKVSYNGNGSPMKGYMDATIWVSHGWGTYGAAGDSYPLNSDTKMWINSYFTSRGYGIVVTNVGIADSGHAVLSVDLDQV
jgi:hypothetical protein